MLGDIKSVLGFRAFRPEPDDWQATWGRRFGGKRTLLLNVGRGQTSWKGIDRKGRVVDGGAQAGDFKEIANAMAAEWRGLTDEGWCAVSLNARYVISLETNVSRKPGAEQLLRSNPRAVLGGRYERGKRYAVTNNPESVATVLLTVEEEQIKQTEAVLKDAGLKTGRMACGAYAMLRRLLETVHAESGKSGKNGGVRAKTSSALFVVCCEGSVCAMLESGELWTDLRSRSDLYQVGETEPVLTILQPLIARLDRDAVVHFVSDGAEAEILAALKAKLAKAEIVDHGVDDYLWRVLADR
jgi:hypothetical protein